MGLCSPLPSLIAALSLGRGVFKPNWALRAFSNQCHNKACVLWKWFQRWLRRMCCPPCLHLLGPWVPGSQVPCLIALSFNPPRNPRSPSPSSLYGKFLFVWKHALSLFIHWICYYLSTLGSVLSTRDKAVTIIGQTMAPWAPFHLVSFFCNLVGVLRVCLHEELSLFCPMLPGTSPCWTWEQEPFLIPMFFSST